MGSFSLIDGGLRCWRCLFAVKDDNNNNKEKTNEKSTIYSEKNKRVSEYCSATTDQLKSRAKITSCHRRQREKVTKQKDPEKNSRMNDVNLIIGRITGLF